MADIDFEFTAKGKGWQAGSHPSLCWFVIYEGVKVKTWGKRKSWYKDNNIYFRLLCCDVVFLVVVGFSVSVSCVVIFVLGLLWDSKNMLLGLRKAFLIRHKHTHTKALTFTCVVLPCRHYYFKRKSIVFFSLYHFFTTIFFLFLTLVLHYLVVFCIHFRFFPCFVVISFIVLLVWSLTSSSGTD